MAVTDGGAITDVLWDSPPSTPAAPGMSVLALNGRVFKGEDLKDAVAAAKTDKAPLTLLVRNFDRIDTIKLDYHGGLQYPSLQRIAGKPTTGRAVEGAMNLRHDVPILLAAVAAIIGASLDGDGRWLHWIAKPLATLLIAAIVWRTDAAPHGYRRAILLGMAFSCIGDIALMLPFDAFVLGLIAFLLAHLCYIVAFRAGFRAGRGLLIAAALLAVFAGINWPVYGRCSPTTCASR